MIDAITSALSGLNKSSAQIEKSAGNIASSDSPDRIIEDIVDIKVAETAFKANLEVIKVANELSEELIKSFDRTV